MKTTADNGRPQRTSRRRRAAAAILLACATTTAGAAIGTPISRPAAATVVTAITVPDSVNGPSCTLSSNTLPITINLILDARKIPVATSEAIPSTGDSTTATTPESIDPKYDAARLEMLEKALHTYSMQVIPLNYKKEGTSEVDGITKSNLDQVLINDGGSAVLTLNYVDDYTKPEGYDHTWIGSDNSDLPSLMKTSGDMTPTVRNLIKHHVLTSMLAGSPSWGANAFFARPTGKTWTIRPSNGTLENWRDGSKSAVLPVPFGNSEVQLLTQDGTSVACGFPANAIEAYPVKATVSNVNGQFAFSVRPPSSTSTLSSNTNSAHILGGISGLLPAGTCNPSAALAQIVATCRKGPSPSNTKKTKRSPLGVAGGGLAGLLVGAGAGAALMATRRKNDGGPDGRRMAGQSFAGPPPGPYGLGGTPHPGAPQPDMSAGISPGGGTNFGTAAPSAAVAGAGAVAAGAAAGVASSVGSQGHGVNAISSAAAANHEWTVAAPGGSTVRLEDIGVARVMPTVTEHGRTWAVGSPDYGATAGWLEKRKGKGEDAEPTMRIHTSGRGIIGVYDGTGGAGAAVARTTGDGTELSAAYVAARLVRDVVEAWFVDCVDDADRALETAGLAATLQRVLNEEAQYLPSSKSNVRGKLHRVLPTTAACVAFDSAGAGGTIDALWAGDSRCFALTAGDGLQVLSRDDTRESDALELIRNDQPMENLVAADRPFRINHRRFAVDAPLVLVTATDGAFGYVRTPAHFEYLLLHALERASTIDDWSAGLLAAFSEFAADDVSFSIVALGFSDFAGLQQAMRSRHDYLAREHWQPFVDKSGDADAIERLRIESWGVYRDLYQARLNGPDAAVAADARPEGQ